MGMCVWGYVGVGMGVGAGGVCVWGGGWVCVCVIIDVTKIGQFPWNLYLPIMSSRQGVKKLFFSSGARYKSIDFLNVTDQTCTFLKPVKQTLPLVWDKMRDHGAWIMIQVCFTWKDCSGMRVDFGGKSSENLKVTYCVKIEWRRQKPWHPG